MNLTCFYIRSLLCFLPVGHAAIRDFLQEKKQTHPKQQWKNEIDAAYHAYVQKPTQLALEI